MICPICEGYGHYYVIRYDGRRKTNVMKDKSCEICSSAGKVKVPPPEIQISQKDSLDIIEGSDV